VCFEASDVIAKVFSSFMHEDYMGLNGIDLKNSSKNQKRGTYEEID
jgi:hypothetical protein